jgi:hypothetical protein
MAGESVVIGIQGPLGGPASERGPIDRGVPLGLALLEARSGSGKDPLSFMQVADPLADEESRPCRPMPFRLPFRV